MKKLMILMLSAGRLRVAQTAQELIDNGKNPIGPREVSSMDGIRTPGRSCGAATPFRRQASPARKPGPRTCRTLGNTAAALIDNGKNPENVTTFGMGYNLNQYSQLSQINRSNVKRLVPVWSTVSSRRSSQTAS